MTRRPHEVSAETLALMVELLPTVGSLRDLGAITGHRLEAVRKHVGPFLAIMKLQGTHPQCGCGRDRFHPYGCADSWAKRTPNGLLPGHSRAETERLLARRKLIVERLVAGDRLTDIDRAFGMSKGGAKNCCRHLTPEQRQQREALSQQAVRA